MLFVLKYPLFTAEPSCFPRSVSDRKPERKGHKMATLLLRTGRLASLKVITPICSETFRRRVFSDTTRSDRAAGSLSAVRKWRSCGRKGVCPRGAEQGRHLSILFLMATFDHLKQTWTNCGSLGVLIRPKTELNQSKQNLKKLY